MTRADEFNGGRGRRFYHATHVELQPGDELKPHNETGASMWASTYERPEESWRGARVWLSGSARHAADWVGDWHAKGTTHVYEVAPEDVKAHRMEIDDEESPDYRMSPQFHAARASVIRRIPPPR